MEAQEVLEKQSYSEEEYRRLQWVKKYQKAGYSLLQACEKAIAIMRVEEGSR